MAFMESCFLLSRQWDSMYLPKSSTEKETLSVPNIRLDFCVTEYAFSSMWSFWDIGWLYRTYSQSSRMCF